MAHRLDDHNQYPARAADVSGDPLHLRATGCHDAASLNGNSSACVANLLSDALNAYPTSAQVDAAAAGIIPPGSLQGTFSAPCKRGYANDEHE